jgi:hypothetical protein
MKAQFATAAGLLFALRAHAQSTIYSGEGFGTYYYDIEQVEACSNDFSAQNTGPVECSLSTALSLDQVNSNYLVAMNHSQLIEDMATFCGKRVIVSVKGVPSSLPLYIGDGCQRCGTGSASSDVWDPNGAPGLDFSYSVLSELSSSACNDGHISISWEIVDETLFDFDTNAPGNQEGPVGGSATVAPAPASQTPSAAPSSSPSPTSDDPVPSTLVTITLAATPSSVSADIPTDSSVPSTVASPTISDSRGPCPTGAWQCNANTLEQCLESSWTSRFVCPDGLTCLGGNSPFCAPAEYE